MTCLRSRALEALPCLLVLASTPAALGEGGMVKPGQTIGEILEPRAAPAAPAAAEPAADGPIGKSAMWACGLALAAGTLAVLRRRNRRMAGASSGAEGVQVLGRAALSHRHAVFVLGVAGRRRVVVGVSGESMTPLLVYEEGEEGARGGSEPRGPGKDGEKGRAISGGFTARPSDQAAVAAALSLDDADLAPYRRQMDRLRGILGGMRPDFRTEPGGRIEPDGRIDLRGREAGAG